MANYVVVDLREGKYVTFYPIGEVMDKGRAVENAAWLNKREGADTHKIMPEMEYYRTYDQDTYNWIIAFQKKEEQEKAQRKLARAAKKAAEEKKLAAAKAWWADDRNFKDVKPWWA